MKVLHVSDRSMPWHQSFDALQAEYGAACGALDANPHDGRAALGRAHAAIKLDLVKRGVWVGDVVTLASPACRGVLQLRNHEPYLIVQTGPAPDDQAVVEDASLLAVEPPWGPPESLTGASVEQLAAGLAASEAVARITAQLIRDGHDVEAFYGDSRLAVLELVARYLADATFAWRNGLVDQHRMRALCVQMTQEGSQFDLPGSQQEWFALELLEAYLQEFRPRVADRAEPRQTGQADRPNDELHASA